jgi:hypothetical protein
MTRLLRSNPMPVLVVLLGLMPAALGMAPGLVRCEHAGDRTHVADATHHAHGHDHAGPHDCMGHTPPAQPDEPSEDAPCEDTPFEIDLAPTQAQAAVDLPDAPLLPVPAWLPAEQSAADGITHAAFFDTGPPAGTAALRVVASTVFRL